MAEQATENIVVRLLAEIDPLIKGLNQAGNEIKGWAAKTRTHFADFEKGALALGAASTGLALALGSATKAFADFEHKLNQVQAVSNTTGAEMDAIREKAMQLGADTEFSASQAADGFFELGKAGFTASEQLASIEGTMGLASAAGIKVGEAAETTTGILRGFRLEASQAGFVADQLAQAANTSAVDVSDLGMSMKYIAPVAASSNQSLSEMMGILSVLGNQMIKGDQAGTTMRSAIVALQKPSKDAAAILGQIGVNIADSQGKMLPFSQIIDQLRDKTAGMTEVQRSNAMATIFGQEALSGMMALVTQAPGEIQKMITAQDQAAGTAKKMADTMNQGLAFQLQQLSGSIETLAIKIGGDLAPALGVATNALTSIVNAFASIPAPIRQILVAVTSMAIIAGTLAAAIGATVAVLPAFTAGFAALTGPIGLAVIGVSALVVAVGAVAGAMSKHKDASLATVQGLQSEQTNVNKLADRYDELAKKANKSKSELEEQRKILKKLEEISPGLVTGYNQQGDATDIARGAVERYNAALREKIRLETKGLETDFGTKQADASTAWANMQGALAKMKEREDYLKLLKKNPENSYLPPIDQDPAYIQLSKEFEASKAEYQRLQKVAETARDQMRLARGQLTPKTSTNTGGTGRRSTGGSGRSTPSPAPSPDPQVSISSAISLDAAKASAGAISQEEHLKRMEANLGKLKQNTSEYWSLWKQIKDTKKEITEGPEKQTLDTGKKTHDLAMEMADTTDQKLDAEKQYLAVLTNHGGTQEEIERTNRRILALQKQQTDEVQKQIQLAIDQAKAMAGLIKGGFDAVNTESLNEKKARLTALQKGLGTMESKGASSGDIENRKQEISDLQTEIAKDDKKAKAAVPGFLMDNAGTIGQLPKMLTDIATGIQQAAPMLSAALPALAPLFDGLSAAAGGLLVAGAPLIPIAAAIVAGLAVFMVAWQQNAGGIQDAFGNLMNAFTGIWDVVVSYFQPVIDGLGATFAVLFDVLSIVVNIAKGVMSAYTAIREKVWDFLNNFTPLGFVIKGIVGIFQGIWNGIIDFYNWVVDLVGKVGIKMDKLNKAGAAQANAEAVADEKSNSKIGEKTTLTGVALARAKNQAGMLSDADLLQALLTEKAGMSESDLNNTQEGISLLGEIKTLQDRIAKSSEKTASGEAFKTALSSITSFNPLPVADVAKGNFFGVGPVGRFFQETRSTMEVVIKAQGDGVNDAALIKSFQNPAVRQAAASMIIRDTGLSGLNPKFS